MNEPRNRLNLSQGLSREELHSRVAEHLSPADTAFNENLTVGELLQWIQAEGDPNTISYFYTVDDKGRLQGIVSTRDLLFSRSDASLKEIASSSVSSLRAEESVEEALKEMDQYKLLALPVLDSEGMLLGVFSVPFDEPIVFDKVPTAEERMAQDVFQLVGMTVEQGSLISSRKEWRLRMPWLLCNLFAGIVCALIASHFEFLLASVVVVSVFIPLVLTLGESVAMQSMTLSMSLLRAGPVPWSQVGSRAWRELKTSLLLSLSCSVLVGIVYFSFFEGGNGALLAISLSLIISMAIATVIAALVPLVLHLLKLDPTVAAGPIVLMVADISVTAIYLTTAMMILT